MLELGLIFALGFLGSFGHCASMCGPIVVAFTLSEAQPDSQPRRWQRFKFNCLLNTGRLISYTLVGGVIGALGSVWIAGGQMAGVGSGLRQALSIGTGLLLIWSGLARIQPGNWPALPFLPAQKVAQLHQHLQTWMYGLTKTTHTWTPLWLGGLWGLIPCGFLYIAQIKAAETGSLWLGAATMAAFSLGTWPTMLGVGQVTAQLSANRRSQLLRLGGWVTLLIGLLTLLRTDAMVDYTGHLSLLLLILALVARPLSRLWAVLLTYRRALGVGAYVLALAHVSHMLDHSLRWRLDAITYLLPQHQWGMGCGILALGLLTPLALTSFDRCQAAFGQRWRQLHLLAIPALGLTVGHALLLGSQYLGNLQWDWQHWLRTGLLLLVGLGVLLLRSRAVWLLFASECLYEPTTKAK